MSDPGGSKRKTAKKRDGKGGASMRAALSRSRRKAPACSHEFTRLTMKDGSLRQGVSLDDERSTYGDFRPDLLSARCQDCGVQLSLGESDEAPVAMEIRAAMLGVPPLPKERRAPDTAAELDGQAAHRASWDGRFDDDELPGWLAREISTHDDRETRDATAWPWDPTRPVAGQFEEWVAKTDRAIEVAGDQAAADSFFDGDVGAMNALDRQLDDLDSTDSDAPTLESIAYVQSVIGPPPTLASTTPLLAIATAGVERPTTWFTGPVADLGRREPHITPDLLQPDDDLTDQPTDPATKFRALAAQVVMPRIWPPETRSEYDARTGTTRHTVPAESAGGTWFCPVASQECEIRRKCTSKCGPAEIEESLAYSESDPADSRVEVTITLGPPEEFPLPDAFDVFGNVYTDDHAAPSATGEMTGDLVHVTSDGRAHVNGRLQVDPDDIPITSGADHIGLTPRMVREQQAAADDVEDTIREQGRHDVAASFVRHGIRDRIADCDDMRRLRGEIEVDIVIGDDPTVPVEHGGES